MGKRKNSDKDIKLAKKVAVGFLLFGVYLIGGREITRWAYNHFLNKRYNQAYQKVLEMSQDFSHNPRRFVDRLESEPKSESLESKLNILEKFMYEKGVIWNNKERHYTKLDPNTNPNTLISVP